MTRRFHPGSIVATLAVFVLAGEFAVKLIPIPAALLRPAVQSIALLDRNGIPLRETRVAERFSHELALEEVPRNVIAAVLAAEDKRFYSHHGIDWLAAGRAGFASVKSGHIVSGASTITQQLVKISGRRPRTLRAKVIEGLTALRLEQSWSKDQILAAYLNRLDFGNLNIGLASAADYYFGKPVSDLSDAEAAFLAGLPENPRRLNPHVAFDAARHRQVTVLRRMRDNRQLDPARFDLAVAEPITLRPPQRRFRAPHFVEMVLQQLPDAPPAEVRTTLDFRLNEQVENIVRERLAQLREQNVRNAAAVVIDNATGDVIALVGSENYFEPEAGQVNGAWAQRSAGSALKPFTYLLALERGATPATMVADVRTSFPADGGFYRPENYNPALLRSSPLPDSAREFVEHSRGQGSGGGRRAFCVASAVARMWSDDSGPARRDLRSWSYPGELRSAPVGDDECLRQPRAPRRISALAGLEHQFFHRATLFATGPGLADR